MQFSSNKHLSQASASSVPVGDIILLGKREGPPRTVSFRLLHNAGRVIFSLVKSSRKLHNYTGAKSHNRSPRHFSGIVLQTENV